MERRRIIGLATLAVVVLTACGTPGGTGTDIRADSGASTSTVASTVVPGEDSPATTTTTSSSSRPVETRGTITTRGTATTVIATTTAVPDPGYRTEETTTTTKVTATTVKVRPKVKMPTGGPKGPVDPPNFDAHEALSSGPAGCQRLLDDIARRWGDPAKPDPEIFPVVPKLKYLYRAAAEACLLRWTEAEADYASFLAVGAAPFESTCSGGPDRLHYCELCYQMALDWLVGQLAAYKAEPTYDPVFVPDDTSPSPCPPEPTTTTTS